MQFSEDDLRSALQRKDPGPDFTQRVMARVAQQTVSQKSVLQKSVLNRLVFVHFSLVLLGDLMPARSYSNSYFLRF